MYSACCSCSSYSDSLLIILFTLDCGQSSDEPWQYVPSGCSLRSPPESLPGEPTLFSSSPHCGQSSPFGAKTQRRQSTEEFRMDTCTLLYIPEGRIINNRSRDTLSWKLVQWVRSRETGPALIFCSGSSIASVLLYGNVISLMYHGPVCIDACRPHRFHYSEDQNQNKPQNITRVKQDVEAFTAASIK